MCGNTEHPVGGSVTYNLPRKVGVEGRGGRVVLESGGR